MAKMTRVVRAVKNRLSRWLGWTFSDDGPDAPLSPQQLRRVIAQVLHQFERDGLARCELNGQPFLLPAEYLQMMASDCNRPIPGVPFRLGVEVTHSRWMIQRLQPGDTALDIGASCGAITALLARAVGPSGQVFSFEPANRAHRLLRQTIEANGLTNVVAEKLAVSDRKGTATFAEFRFSPQHQYKWLPEASSLFAPRIAADHPGAYAETSVETIPLDDYFRDYDRSIRVIKIDVEGFEVEVLKGARETVERFRPDFSIDIHRNPHGDGDTEAQVREDLSRWDYRFERVGHVLLAYH
jgi:FkbM family methyltransferase